MCGIAGYWLNKPNWNDKQHQTTIKSMVEVLHHRGPDDRGSGWERDTGLAFGHRRLAVQDLSTAGRQPLLSQDGRYLLIYNGEIYNAPLLRRELEQQDISFRGTSDTEVLLEALAAWGLDKTLSKLNGMFAFALWNRRDKKLTLARDRVGIKPLYYGHCRGTLLFASELKALFRFPEFTSELDPAAVTEFFQIGYISAPRSIEKGIHKLPPGTSITFSSAEQNPKPEPYWSLHDTVQQIITDRQEITAESALGDLEFLLTKSVKDRLISDVPIGAFLSGGIDSSLIVALMQRLHGSPVKTFSIGFQEQKYNEAEHARKIAKHLGTDHHELMVDPQMAMDVIPQLASIYDEPFADASQIPTLILSQFARKEVTVALSGDGGDELFAGYQRYPYFVNRWAKVNGLGGPLRGALGKLLSLGSALPVPSRFKQAAQSRAELTGVKSFREYYERFNRHWKHPEEILRPEYFQTPAHSLADPGFSVDEAGWIDWMRYQDLHRYLPDDILTKVDRASMAHGLEVRVPLLDHQLIEWSWQLPGSLKQGNQLSETSQQGKVLLRKLLAKFVPQELFERPKVGFGVPLDHWLRGPLRDWAEERLSVDALESSGILNPTSIRQRWQEHVSGQLDWQYLLWDVLMFQEFLSNREQTV
ncbi:Asparagine synthetase [glutamine-hydrolyzing] 1 [Polystyrenella longa]|uniref:asparagine synthase (glutamine-hydrolyzing) n=1 Tax=Polystyrenella longa TaxID=2528007 RepID=A0A518CJH4_9PLAN|nr:asparagine synthase (glutamine-hydrolyzing) [Polystyrenella longa]QDU79357.1 Asparagine synthetase [glutamine-hydrolyzing] 1 [Polystyrenella longa]